ncbi:MAG: GAF domain-containing protein [Gammaproteobacteria bacterium]|nr:GAF domain-containing protein [Gammaproteobacteria bacterium]
MEAPRIPSNEKERLETLLRLRILDTPSDDRYDRYTQICTRLFDVPIAVISLVDKYRQWFKSACGLDARETPRKISFCGHAILNDDIFEVQDALQDPRFRDNPLVEGAPNIRFYAGAPLNTPNNQNIGTLCIIDSSPRHLGEEERVMLKNLADMVVDDMVRYIDLATGLDNRNALIVAGDNALARARPDQAFHLTLLNVAGVIEQQPDRTRKNDWRDRFASYLHDHFAHAASIAHLGNDQYCIMHERHAALPVFDILHHACASTDPKLQTAPIYVGDIDVRHADSIAMEDLLREVDGLFFRGNTKPLPEMGDKH